MLCYAGCVPSPQQQQQQHQQQQQVDGRRCRDAVKQPGTARWWSKMGTRSRKEGGMAGNDGDGSAPSAHSGPGDGTGARSSRLCFYAGAGAGGCCRWCRIHPRMPQHAATAGATGARWIWDEKRGVGVDNGKRAAAAIGSKAIDEGRRAPWLACWRPFRTPLQEACSLGLVILAMRSWFDGEARGPKRGWEGECQREGEGEPGREGSERRGCDRKAAVRDPVGLESWSVRGRDALRRQHVRSGRGRLPRQPANVGVWM